MPTRPTKSGLLARTLRLCLFVATGLILAVGGQTWSADDVKAQVQTNESMDSLIRRAELDHIAFLGGGKAQIGVTAKQPGLLTGYKIDGSWSAQSGAKGTQSSVVNQAGMTKVVFTGIPRRVPIRMYAFITDPAGRESIKVFDGTLTERTLQEVAQLSSVSVTHNAVKNGVLTVSATAKNPGPVGSHNITYNVTYSVNGAVKGTKSIPITKTTALTLEIPGIPASSRIQATASIVSDDKVETVKLWESGISVGADGNSGESGTPPTPPAGGAADGIGAALGSVEAKAGALSVGVSFKDPAAAKARGGTLVLTYEGGGKKGTKDINLDSLSGTALHTFPGLSPSQTYQVAARIDPPVRKAGVVYFSPSALVETPPFTASTSITLDKDGNGKAGTGAQAPTTPSPTGAAKVKVPSVSVVTGTMTAQVQASGLQAGDTVRVDVKNALTGAAGPTKTLTAAQLADGAESVTLTPIPPDANYEVSVSMVDAKGVVTPSDSTAVYVDGSGNGEAVTTTAEPEPGTTTGGTTTAGGSPFKPPVKPGEVPDYSTFGDLWNALKGLAVRLALYLSVIFVIIAGYLYITGGDDEKAAVGAKRSLRHIVYGLALIGMAQVAVSATYRSVTDQSQGAVIFWDEVLKPIVNLLVPFALAWTVLAFVIAGFQLITSNGDEAVMKTARRTINYGFIGLLVIGLAESAVGLLASGAVVEGDIWNILTPDGNDAAASALVNGLLQPILRFIVSFVGVISIIVFVKAGYDFMTNESKDKAKTELQYGIVGLLVIGLAETVVKTFVNMETSEITLNGDGAVALIFQIINFALSFLGSIALLMIVYAGFLIVTDAGEGSRKKKGQEIIQYTAIGIMVILFSYAIVNIFLTGGKAYV